MSEVYGENGRSWLKRLPAILQELAARWQITLQAPFSLSYNYAAPAIRADGAPVVLKIGVPNPELYSEIEALRLYNGRFICHLLACDLDRGALLLEHIQPGQPLWTLADDEAETAVAGQLMQQLWLPLPDENAVIPNLAQRTAGLLKLSDYFEDGFGPFPRRLVETAVALRQELLAENIPPMLLHGDFHHDNILSAQRQPWLALDPKGVRGDPAYEVGSYLYNPIGFCQQPNLAQLVARRLDQFADILGIDRQRLIGWGIVQAVLSAVWSYEDHADAPDALSPTLQIADILTRL
jgi:streptomycin 6-kinase